MENKIRIIIAEDQEIYLEGLRSLFRKNEQFEIIGVTNSVKELMNILQRADPDIVLLAADIKPPGSMVALSRITTKRIEVPVVILGVRTSPETIHEFIILGAKGYIYRNLKSEDFIKKIYEVHKSGSAIDSKILLEILNLKTKAHLVPGTKRGLTPAEKNIYLALKEGKSEKQIATERSTTVDAVHKHKQNMFKKTGTHSVTQLFIFVERHGWV